LLAVTNSIEMQRNEKGSMKSVAFTKHGNDLSITDSHYTDKLHMSVP
jgi:hypothetical protein